MHRRAHTTPPANPYTIIQWAIGICIRFNIGIRQSFNHTARSSSSCAHFVTQCGAAVTCTFISRVCLSSLSVVSDVVVAVRFVVLVACACVCDGMFRVLENNKQLQQRRCRRGCRRFCKTGAITIQITRTRKQTHVVRTRMRVCTSLHMHDVVVYRVCSMCMHIARTKAAHAYILHHQCVVW